ncbi:MAG: metallophosphoesterase [Synechococcus sp.]|nr:metallophosphoesterase [Synechococcus sp.]
MVQSLRVVQLSDPHLVGDPNGQVRGRPALRHWNTALQHAALQHPDLLLITGDCCQDESWNGYALLRESLNQLLPGIPVAVMPGNHDHPGRLRTALGGVATSAPAVIQLSEWALVVLSSHWCGKTAGRIGIHQQRWLEDVLQDQAQDHRPVLLALHHPPIKVGDAHWDGIGLDDSEALIAVMQASPQVKGVVFGHLHQHWQGSLPQRPDVSLWGCPSTLCSFPALQLGPLNRNGHPGGHLIELFADGEVKTTVVHWPSPTAFQADVARA